MYIHAEVVPVVCGVASECFMLQGVRAILSTPFYMTSNSKSSKYPFAAVEERQCL